MSDKERLNGIIIRYKTVKPFEFYNDIGIIAMDEKGKDWLIEQAEKVEQLQQTLVYRDQEIEWYHKQLQQAQQENERLKKFLSWEQEEAQGLDEEVTFQLEQLKRAQEEIERLEKRYEFASQIESELRQEIQQLQRQLQKARENISETLDLLKRGGPGTRSQVQALLEKALEETK
jgi:DNA repair exonuclease SbcCD ATPase subunit